MLGKHGGQRFRLLHRELRGWGLSHRAQHSLYRRFRILGAGLRRVEQRIILSPMQCAKKDICSPPTAHTCRCLLSSQSKSCHLIPTLRQIAILSVRPLRADEDTFWASVSIWGTLFLRGFPLIFLFLCVKNLCDDESCLNDLPSD